MRATRRVHRWSLPIRSVPICAFGIKIMPLSARWIAASSATTCAAMADRIAHRRPYSMGQLVRDAEKIARPSLEGARLRLSWACQHRRHGGAGACESSGWIWCARVVLSNTAAKIGQPAMWAEQDRRGAARAEIEALADATMERWFTRAFRASPDMRLTGAT